MRMNIYVQDELAEEVKKVEGLNVSAVCQAALRDKVDSHKVLAALTDGMTRVEVYVEEPYGSDVAFVGKEIGYVDTGAETTVYLTRQGRIVAYDHYHTALHQYETFQDFAEVMEEGRPDLVAEVARAIGEKHVIELDI